MGLSLDTVKCNFQEIYYDSHQEQSSQGLISSPFGRLYHKNRGFGVFWTIVYFILRPFFTKSWQDRKLEETVRKTMEAYLSSQNEAKAVFASYKKTLSNLAEEVNLEATEFQKERFKLAAWNDSTLSFVKMKVKDKAIPVFEEIKLQNPNSIDPFLSFDFSLAKESIRYDALLNLERLSEVNLPYPILTKICFNKALKQEDSYALTEWILAIKTNKKVEQPHLHKGLKSFVDHLQVYHQNSFLPAPSLARLEVELFREGLSLINGEDKKQLAFQKSLVKGAKIMIQDRTITLGDELIGVKKEKNETRIFLMDEHPNQVLAIARNRAILEIREFIAKTSGGGIRFPKFIFLDPEGRFQIRERLKTSILERNWISDSWLEEEDAYFLHPLVGQIKACIETNTTPSHFEAEYLYYNDKNVLHTSKPTTNGDFNFNKLEMFIYKVSKSNRTIMRALFDESKLHEHKEAAYFKEVLHNLVEETELSAEGIACLSKHNIKSIGTIKAGEKLHNKMKRIGLKIRKKLMRELPIEDPVNLPKEIYTILLKLHLEEGFLSFILPGFQKRASAFITSTFKG